MKQTSRLILTTSPPAQTGGKFPGLPALRYRRRLPSRGMRRMPTGKELDSETGLYYFGARYLDPKTARWISGDPAISEYVPVAPVSDEARKRNGSLPGQGGVFNVVNLHVYHYAGNNPVRYTDPDGEKSGLATDSDGVPLAGHSAMYVEVYDDDGNHAGYAFFEVAATSLGKIDLTKGKKILSSDKLDASSPPQFNDTNLGKAWAKFARLANSAGIQAGVTYEFLASEAELEKRLAKYDRVVELSTTDAQDRAIHRAAMNTGSNFGRYNLFSNNCVQFASKALSRGGVNTTNDFIPNKAHGYVLRNNENARRRK